MSTNGEEVFVERGRRERVLQRIIDAMVRNPRGWDAELAARELERRIADHGLPAMPPPWVEAVATGIVRGEPYIISARTVEEVDVPAPRTTSKPYGIS